MVERENSDGIGDLSRSQLVPLGTLENVRRPEVFLKIARSILGDTLSNARLLDVACGDNFLLQELVAAGATYLGIEARQRNIDNAWSRVPESMRDRVSFQRGAAQDLSATAHGQFDLILVAGLIYHLSHTDQFELLKAMGAMCGQVLIVDTSLTPEQSDKTLYYALNGCIYSGTGGLEHGKDDSKATIENRLRASYSDSGAYPSFIQTRSCLIRMLRNLGYDQVVEYCYPGNLNDFNMAIALDNVQTVGAFRPNLRRVLAAPIASGLSAPRVGPFEDVAHDGSYGSIGPSGMAVVGEIVAEHVETSSPGAGYARTLDAFFQTLPLKLNYAPLAYLIGSNLPSPLVYRFFKGYIDPVIRYGSARDRERALALFAALLRKTEAEHSELAGYAAESFHAAYTPWYPFDLMEFFGDSDRFERASAWLAQCPVAVPPELMALLQA